VPVQLPFTHTSRAASLPALIRSLRPRQLIPFWLAIFSTFAMIGFVLDILTGGRQPPRLLALNVICSGLFAVGYGMVSMPMRRWGYAALVTVHMAYVIVVPRLFSLLPMAPPRRFVLDAVGTLVAVTVGYSCFMRFISFTATRYMRAQAEIALARDIHRVLVPPVEGRIGGFEFLGWSLASGDVGGDLVDVVEQDGAWMGYIADVSGHGVGPGVVLGMFKSALRMRVRTGGPISSVLDDVHAVLMPLKQSNTFVTVACIRGGTCNQVECAVAGHLPILRARNGIVEEVTSPQIAIGMFDGTTFESSSVECLPGDVFALLTDGLVEVFDGERQELGLDWAKRVIAASDHQPLSAIADRILADAHAHGVQLDDQTLLLIRRTA
jgi:sigma-B regulation protein RsbU (phosphoserine phosphatase)